MPKGGKRLGAGRKKGVPNKMSLAKREKISTTGKDPLDVMIEAMRFHHDYATYLQARYLEEKAADPNTRPTVDERSISDAYKMAAGIAKEAAPYVHPRLAAATQEVDAKDESGGIKQTGRVIINFVNADGSIASAR